MRENTLLGFTFLLFICSCKPAATEQQNTNSEYFDIKGYFDKEIARLSKLQPTIKKTVAVNNELETKALKIKDWKQELTAFSEAEINRASWKGLFAVSKTDSVQRYLSNNEKVPVKEITISSNKGEIKKILVVIQNKNILYTSLDSLTYCIDSLYQVKKQQNIRFLSDKNYLIEGRFK
jgi:hypothetical protein